MGENDTLVLRSTEQTAEGTWAISDPAWRHLPALRREVSRLRAGDLLVTKSSGSSLHLGKTTFVTADEESLRAGFSNFMQRLRTDEDLVTEFAWYAMRSRFVRDQIDLLSTTSTGLANLTASALGDLVIPVPTVSEQRMAVQFLDRETGEIDAFIRDQEELIGLLQEQRAATISHAVTKGLNPDAPRVQSGTAWGKIPAHWRPAPLKHVANLLAGFPFASEVFRHDLNSISLLRGINVGVGEIDWTERVGWPRDLSGGLSVYDLKDGDLVLGLDRPVISRGIRLARMCPSDLPALLLQRVARLRATDGALNTFLEYVLCGAEFRNYIEPLFTGVSVPHLSIDQLGAFVIPTPPRGEQSAISSYLESELQLIDASISDANAAVELSRERRSALISAAVTGKIDVREHVGV
ncbi:hypothetical protein AX769_22710 (plasmid) [Frondihabitans sp. PAMC 28766]|nr:hypothetical protein AX769_22710 [Frondihabitans sp. PAMC 28766]